MKYNDNGEIKEIKIKVADTLPIGTVVDYDGDTVPSGWEEIGSEDYSTEEVYTGKHWIDGKKIYSIVHNVTENFASGSVNNKNISSLNIENIVKIDCIIATNTGINGDLAQGFQSYVLNDKSILRSYNGTGVNVNYFHTTIEYTKTTD